MPPKLSPSAGSSTLDDLLNQILFRDLGYGGDYGAPILHTNFDTDAYVRTVQNRGTDGNAEHWLRSDDSLLLSANDNGVAIGHSLALDYLTAGSIPFVGGAGSIVQDNGNLFWNAADLRLGVGTNLPLAGLDLVSTLGLKLHSGALTLGMSLVPDVDGNLLVHNGAVSPLTILTLDQSTGNLALTPTWTTGVQDALSVDVIDGGAGATSNLINLLVATVRKFSVTKGGEMRAALVRAMDTNVATGDAGIELQYNAGANSGAIYSYDRGFSYRPLLVDASDLTIVGAAARKLGFYGTTPIAQPAGPAALTGASTLGDTQTAVNALRSVLRNLGLMS